jgi:hypothetical protein
MTRFGVGGDEVWVGYDAVWSGCRKTTMAGAGWLGEFLKGYVRKKLDRDGVERVILRMAILAALLRRATKRCVFEARNSGA